MHSDDPHSVPPEKRPAAILKKIVREDSHWVDLVIKKMEWKKANENRLQWERFRTQLSDAIEDTEYWLTLKPTTKERGYVSHIVEVLSLWRQGVNEILSGAQLSDAQRHLYGREYPQLFLHFYRKASKARGERVGEHLRDLADGLSSKFAEANKTAVETWVASRKAGRKPMARDQKPADVQVRMGNRVSTATASRKKKGERKATTEELIFSASDDYRNIAFRGEKHFLTKNQATIVRLLHEAYKRGQPMVPEDRLLFAIDSQTELRSYFRGAALWGTLVIKGPRKGTFQFNLTPVSPGSKPQSSR